MLMVINENIVFTAGLINELAVNKHNDRVIVMLGQLIVENSIIVALFVCDYYYYYNGLILPLYPVLCCFVCDYISLNFNKEKLFRSILDEVIYVYNIHVI